jgi:hypothetical protein
MANQHFIFLTREFVQWKVPYGNSLGRTVSVDEVSISVSFWDMDADATVMIFSCHPE